MASPSVPWLLVSPLFALTACAGWPRFADPHTLPPAFEKYPVAYQVEERVDFPPGCEPDCAFEPPEDRMELPHLFEAGKFSGTISSSSFDDQQTFGSLDPCPGAEGDLGINGAYGGDLDFVQVGVPSGGLCLVLDPGEQEGTPPGLWDVVVYPYDGGQSCISGGFLSRGLEGLAASTHMPGTNFAMLGPGSAGSGTREYLVLIGIPETTDEPWDYDLYLLPTRDDPRSCLDAAHDDLTAEDFEEIQ
jgi:hypothetical protein